MCGFGFLKCWIARLDPQGLHNFIENKMINTKNLKILACSFALLLSSCSTYRMPNLPEGGYANIAVLEVKDKENHKFFITEVDGRFRGIGLIERYELTPGIRSIKAEVNPTYWGGDSITRYFDAQAGKQYFFVINDDIQNKKWGFSIIEKTTGKKVDFDKPPMDSL